MKNIILIIFSIFALITGAFANASSLDSFESQVFYQMENAQVQLIELSQEEMQETQGEIAPVVVYGLIGTAGRIAYVGITNNFKRRITTHARTKTFRNARVLGTYNSRIQARIAEQNFINRYNTINRGMNRINSISPRNPLSRHVTVPYRR